MSVIVVGSFITDCIATCKVAPKGGETVRGLSFNTYLGGKGANQAVASIRMGSDTLMLGAVGDDNFGHAFIDCLKNEGFDTNYIVVDKKNPTGTSLVTVEESGQNRIVMTPGANTAYDYNLLKNYENEIKNANCVVTQCETTLDVVVELSRLCKKHNVKYIVNPAPALKLPDEVLDGLFLLTPNENELGIQIAKNPETLDEYIAGAKEMLKKGVKNVIVTLGVNGSLLVNNDGTCHIPSFKVKAVDTLGAGDSFTGSLSAMIDQGYSIIDAMKIATAVAALEVQKPGGIPAMPYKEEVFKFLEKAGK